MTQRPSKSQAAKIVRLPLRRSQYQIFPALSLDLHEALKASIKRREQEQPIVCDRQGNIVDGWERAMCCQELGIEPRREVRDFEDEAEKFQYVLAVNAHRRPNLNQKQKRAVIDGYLRGDPGVADNCLAQTLVVSKNTVLKVRQRLEASGIIRKIERTRGKDGKLRPVRYAKRIITNGRKEFDRAREIIKALPDNCSGKTLDIISAERRARRHKRSIEREARIIEPLPVDAIQLFHCRFQDLEKKARIKPGSIRLILTDVPYDKRFLPQVAELGALAQRWLAEGGLFVCMYGQYYLNLFIRTMDAFLTWRWQNTSVWQASASPVRICGQSLISKSKPIVIYSKGRLTRGNWCDTHHSKLNDKEWHPMQQPLEVFEQQVRYFSHPGDLVVDPCGGGFTTAEACLRLGRRCISCDVDSNCVANGQKRLQLVRESLRAGA